MQSSVINFASSFTEVGWRDVRGSRRVGASSQTGPLLATRNGGSAAPVLGFWMRWVCLFSLGLVEGEGGGGAVCAVAGFVVGDDGDGD
jgi:hypothetical protein